MLAADPRRAALAVGLASSKSQRIVVDTGEINPLYVTPTLNSLPKTFAVVADWIQMLLIRSAYRATKISDNSAEQPRFPIGPYPLKNKQQMDPKVNSQKAHSDRLPLTFGFILGFRGPEWWVGRSVG